MYWAYLLGTVLGSEDNRPQSGRLCLASCRSCFMNLCLSRTMSWCPGDRGILGGAQEELRACKCIYSFLPHNGPFSSTTTWALCGFQPITCSLCIVKNNSLGVGRNQFITPERMVCCTRSSGEGSWSVSYSYLFLSFLFPCALSLLSSLLTHGFHLSHAPSFSWSPPVPHFP